MSELVRAPAPSADLVIRGAHVLDPRERLDDVLDVVIRGGTIAELAEPGATVADGIEQIAGDGLHLMPAFVDPHVHLRSPGEEHKEDIETGTRAAAAGGYCAVVAMPNTNPVIDSPEALAAVRETASRDARVAVGFMPAITHGLLGERLTDMTELRTGGALGFTDDGRPVASAAVLRRALQYQRLCGGVLALHEEDPSLSQGGAMHEGVVAATLGIAGIPSLSESTMVARDAALAEDEQARIHVQHLSCRASVEAVAAACERGVRISAEASPHHLLLTEHDVADMDTRMKMNPPLRTREDRDALVQALRDGTIECVATDHAPHAREDKEVPFEQAAMGTTGLETAFAALHTGLVLEGALSLETLVMRLTAGAELLGLPCPAVRAGREADLVLVDLAATWTAGDPGYESRSENCCFGGRELRGRVRVTLAQGAVAYRERSFALSAA